MVEYRVYVRFEDTPAIARENSEQEPDPEYGPLTLEAVSGSNPGEETPMLHEALETVRENGKFIALYRGKHAGYNRRGAELFIPVGLAWCKDSFELAQMLGVDIASAQTGNERNRLNEDNLVNADNLQNRGRSGGEDLPYNSTTPRTQNHEPQTIPQEHTRPSQRGNRSGPASPSADVPSRGWLVWTGIIAGAFVASFVVVYGLAKLIG